MVELDQLLTEQNVAHYRNRLHMGAEPVTRSVVLKLLIDKHIEKLRRIMDQQQKRIDRSKFILPRQ